MTEPNRKTQKYSITETGIKAVDGKTARYEGWRFEMDTYESAGEVNVDNKIQKTGPGWVPHGGMILKNIYHDGYRLGYDIGVVGIYVFPGKKARDNGHKPKFLILGPPDFVQIDSNAKRLTGTESFNPKLNLNLTGNKSLPNNFSVFNNDITCALKVDWVSKYPLFGKDSGSLFVSQRYVFTRYDNRPAHEPSGALPAARLHPFIDLTYGKAAEDWVESIRVDYRFYLNLDTWWYESPHNPMLLKPVGQIKEKGRQTKKGKINNAAGVFADKNKFDLSLDGAKAAMKNGVAGGAFHAAEKPLVAEITSSGLNTASGKTEWDNVHWWGTGSDWKAGSAPGSFHAIHMHWRWALEGAQKKFPSYVIVLPNPVPPHTPIVTVVDNPLNRTIPYAGKKQFRGSGYGTSLTDPNIDKQKIRLAVVKNTGLPADYHAQRGEDFFEYFEKLRQYTPHKIKDGADLILYYSAEINLKNRSTAAKINQSNKMTGTVCLHGLYFAHDDEPSLLQNLFTGKTGNVYINPSSPNSGKMRRYPS